MRYQLLTTVKDEDTRLDQFLACEIPSISRTEIRARIDLGGVHLDGKRIRKCGLKLKAGSRVELYTDRGPRTPFRLTPEDILYEDNYLLVINKPAGVESQPTKARLKGCLYEAVESYLKEKMKKQIVKGRRRNQQPSIGMVQRLDRDTSGVILFSIHKKSHAKLTEMVKSRKLTREYLAVVTGCPSPAEGEYRTRLARPEKNTSRTVSSGGKEAVTRYRVLDQFPGYAAVSATLITGRTHQIRAQFSNEGHPLLGDKKYGGPDQLNNQQVDRHFLHARRLHLIHPMNQNVLNIEAPIPVDILNFLQPKTRLTD